MVSVLVATLIIVSKVTPRGRATRISLTISALGIFRVVKIITLISVKCLIRSNLQGASNNIGLVNGCQAPA